MKVAPQTFVELQCGTQVYALMAFCPAPHKTTLFKFNTNSNPMQNPESWSHKTFHSIDFYAYLYKCVRLEIEVHAQIFYCVAKFKFS